MEGKKAKVYICGRWGFSSKKQKLETALAELLPAAKDAVEILPGEFQQLKVEFENQGNTQVLHEKVGQGFWSDESPSQICQLLSQHF